MLGPVAIFVVLGAGCGRSNSLGRADGGVHTGGSVASGGAVTGGHVGSGGISTALGGAGGFPGSGGDTADVGGGSGGAGSSSKCTPGSDACSCGPSGMCNAGLVCLSGLCASSALADGSYGTLETGGDDAGDVAGEDGNRVPSSCTQYGVDKNSCGATCGLYPAPLVSGSDPLCPPCSPLGPDQSCPEIGLVCDYLDAPVGGFGAYCRCETSGWTCAL
jgi:hypothetical protein